MKKYLFRDDHNGYYVTYQPFEISGSLSQEKANELILSVLPMAKRMGSHIWDLLEAIDKRNIAFKEYHSIYYKVNEYEERYHTKTDPLPDCMYKWVILECISGNY